MRSYRELPVRFSEFGTVYRYERSGVMHGLTRVRGFTQDDAHLFCTPDQLQGEFEQTLDEAVRLMKAFGFTDVDFVLSSRDRSERIDTDPVAELAIRTALERHGFDYTVDEGGGAFYGPKLDINVRDAIGRKWQLGTVQVDFVLPGRFDLRYRGDDGHDHTPVMIHRALAGSLERFFGIVVEHFGGAFPAWLAPVQVVAIPITDEQVPYLTDVALLLKEKGVRVEIDDSDDRMQKKIRTASKQKIPFVLIAGATDAEAGAVSFRYRDGSQRNGVPVAEAVAQIADWIAARHNVDPSAEGEQETPAAG
jgi:threonyl-tRNA synthetase